MTGNFGVGTLTVDDDIHARGFDADRSTDFGQEAVKLSSNFSCVMRSHREMMKSASDQRKCELGGWLSSALTGQLADFLRTDCRVNLRPM